MFQADDTDRSAKYGKLVKGKGGKMKTGKHDDAEYWRVRRWKSSEAADARVTKAVIADKVRPKDTAWWFNSLGNLESIKGLGNLDMSDARSMRGMFSWCGSLESIDLSKLDTSNVRDMSCMFGWCMALDSLDISALDTAKVENMSEMFRYCPFESLDLSTFDISRVTDMSYMFDQCLILESINLSGLDMSRVKSVCGMFSWCQELKTIDLSGLDFSTAKDVTDMFAQHGEGTCEIRKLDLSKTKFSDEADLSGLLEPCHQLRKVTVGDRYNFGGAFPTNSGDYGNGPYVAWKNERGEVFSTYDIPARTAGTYTRVRATSIEKATVSVAKTRTYTGRALKPAVKVKLGKRTLVEGRDYKLTYKNNVKVGRATVRVRGMGIYAGVVRASFDVRPQGTDIAKVTAGKSDFTVKWDKQEVQTGGYQVRWSTSKSMKGATVKTVKGRASTSLKVPGLKPGKRY